MLTVYFMFQQLIVTQSVRQDRKDVRPQLCKGGKGRANSPTLVPFKDLKVLIWIFGASVQTSTSKKKLLG